MSEKHNTSPRVAEISSDILRDPTSGPRCKAAAGSALRQALRKVKRRRFNRGRNSGGR